VAQESRERESRERESRERESRERESRERENRETAGLLWVDRTASILNSLGDAPRGAGITELSRVHGIPKSTLHRMLTALRGHDFVLQDAETRRYRLGPALARLGHRFLEQFPIRQAARPHLRGLADRIGLACYLSVLQNREAVCVETAEGQYGSLSLFVRVGRSMPPHTSAAAKVLLAYQPEQQAREILRRVGPLHRFTPFSKTSPEDVLGELREVRALGHARCTEELQVGVVALSVPVFGAGGHVEASLTAVGPAGVMTPDFERDVLAGLNAAARAISEDLGHRRRAASAEV
jgi:IclR family KDG regulon transcriptional repressor